MSLDHNDWRQFDARGYQHAVNVEVREYPEATSECATVRIGRSLHRRDDLTISEDGRRIETAAGYLTR
jgi:hypothetical protein